MNQAKKLIKSIKLNSVQHRKLTTTIKILVQMRQKQKRVVHRRRTIRRNRKKSHSQSTMINIKTHF